MLKTLHDTQKELTKNLSTCPGGATTIRARKYKESLLARLGEVDAAIKVFSRPVVFVTENR